MTGTSAPCATERSCEALRSALLRRVGNLLQRVTVVRRNERIVVEVSCRSYYAAQLTLSALSARSSEDRKRPISLSIRVKGRVLVLHLPPTESGVEGRLVPNESATNSTTRDVQLQNAT